MIVYGVWGSTISPLRNMLTKSFLYKSLWEMSRSTSVSFLCPQVWLLQCPWTYHLCIEWPNPANHRPSHWGLGVKTYFNGEVCLSTSFTSAYFFMSCQSHVILTVIISDMLVNSWLGAIWGMSVLSRLITWLLKGRHYVTPYCCLPSVIRVHSR